jgi:hypothetical protein
MADQMAWKLAFRNADLGPSHVAFDRGRVLPQEGPRLGDRGTLESDQNCSFAILPSGAVNSLLASCLHATEDVE